MRLNSDIKAYCLCAMFLILVPSSNAAASSVEILVDAALDQSSSSTAKEVILQVTRAAGVENTVGIVVYDEVFQRSAGLAVVDQTHAERISQVLESVTSSEFSNIAVGIEKGISELSAEGGVLLVFGNSDILLAEPEAIVKYTDWLELVILPDAASKSISIILAMPQNSKPSTLSATIRGFSNNRVITFIDASDAIDQLSLILPFTLPAAVPGSAVVGVTDQSVEGNSLQVSEQAQGETSSSRVDAAQDEGAGLKTVVLLVVLVLLVLLAGAIILLVRKRNGSTRRDLTKGSVASVADEPLSRYLAPMQGNTIARTSRVRETDPESTMLMPQPDTLKKSPDSEPSDEPLFIGSDMMSNDREPDLDATAPRLPVENSTGTSVVGADATVQRLGISAEESLVSCETGVIDELEELRNITQLKHETHS